MSARELIRVSIPSYQTNNNEMSHGTRHQTDGVSNMNDIDIECDAGDDEDNDADEEDETHVRIDKSSNSFLFWKFLSNLPKSITQRSKSTASSTLTPEVVGYIARESQLYNQQEQQQKQQQRQQHHARDAHEVDNLLTTSGEPNPDLEYELEEKSSSQGQQRHVVRLVEAPGERMIVSIRQAKGCQSTNVPSSNTSSSARLHQTKVSNESISKLSIASNRNARETSTTRTTLTTSGTRSMSKGTPNATNVTTTTTTSLSSSGASSLSSCILSESTTNSEVRLKWGKKMDFLLSIIGFAVDLANIWRFPYLVYKNGGGVFLIPYTTMLIFGGIPLFFLELCLGQYVKKGPITVWDKICPKMKGVGYCSILISWYVSFYYNVLIAWSVYFIYRSLGSFGDKLPWEDCDNPWNSKSCVSISHLKSECSIRNETLGECRKAMFASVNVTSPASEFFVKELSQIDQSTGLDDMGYLRMELVLCTAIVYALHYFSLFRGLETSGKVVWVTATAPYVILSILLVRGLFLPGASMGIEYYLSPKLEKLRDPQVWIDAAGQVFYSIGVGFGVHLTYASFNSHNNNCHRDCLTTSAVNAVTSVYSGLVVFVYLGYMASALGTEIDKVASEGYSLVFEVYPEALTTLPFALFWSILFFIMLLTLGIDSAMGGLEAVITGLEDEFKFLKRLSRGQLTGLVILSSFVPALVSCTQGGAYTLFWFDIYSAGVSLLFSALFETIGVVYCYGLDKFIVNIESMLGHRPHLFYIICWKYISPIFLVAVIIMAFSTASVPIYRNYTFPNWSVILGWCLAFSSVAAIPVVACIQWLKERSAKSNKLKQDDTPAKRHNRPSSGATSASNRTHRSSSKKTPRSSPQHHETISSVLNCGLTDVRGKGRQLTNVATTTLMTNPPYLDESRQRQKIRRFSGVSEEML